MEGYAACFAGSGEGVGGVTPNPQEIFLKISPYFLQSEVF